MQIADGRNHWSRRCSRPNLNKEPHHESAYSYREVPAGGDRPMSGEELTIGISALTVVSGGINVYVGLRLAALQAQMKADSAAAEIALVRQFIAWKDEILQLLNGKYVTATLVAEIRTGIAHDVSRIDKVLDRIERRCEERGPIGCIFHQTAEHPPEEPK
jgi:hypothetical protein